MKDVFDPICKKFITISRNEGTFCEWSNWHFAVRTPKGIHFYEFSHNLESLDKRLDYVETFMGTLTLSPSVNIYGCKLVRNGLKNRDISEMMLDPALWGHSDHLMNEMANVIMFEFSPGSLIRKKACVLAILNNMGYVTFHAVRRNQWVNVLDISSHIKDQLEEGLKVPPTTFDELKQKAYNLATSSMCWAPQLKYDHCYFITCQKSGILFLWVIQSQGDDIVAKYCGKIELAYEVFHIKWIPKTDTKFFLLIGNISGQVMFLECQINKKHVVLLKTHTLWDHQDKMITKFSQYHIEENRILLFYNKHRHLVAQLIDENCKIISQCMENINDYKITSIAKKSNEIYVTTVNFQMYKLNYCINNDELKVTYDAIVIKDISPTLELSSVSFSPNGVISALCTIDRRIMHKKDPLQMETHFIQNVPDDKVLNIILENPTKRLTCHWDCIELLRFKIVKLKKLPEMDFKKLLSEGETDVYKLKIYLIILRINTTLMNNIKITNNVLPENSIELIKEKILMHQAKANIKYLYSKNNAKKSLNNFEVECFVGSKKFLTYYSKKYKTALSDIIAPDKLSLVANEIKYTCQCCDEKNDFFSCVNGHLNMFCSLTFTPIENFEYVSCKYCNSIARIETYSDKPLCVYCDSYMEHCDFCD